MNFDTILNSNIVVDTKVCKDNNKECGIPIITKEKKEKAEKAEKADKVEQLDTQSELVSKKDDVNIVIKSCKTTD